MSAPIVDAAVEYRRRGWSVIPINAGSKRPVVKDWQNLRLTEVDLRRHFSAKKNIGVLLGQASGGLIDIDLDCSEAMLLAPRFLPPTSAVFGRASKEESHWLYTVGDIPSTVQYETPAPEGAMLVELRSTGGQTVFPPSIHPSGERYEWHSRGDAAQVEATDLIERVALLAAASLLARSWPERGARNKTSLALAGGLLRSGWDTDKVKAFIVAVAEAAGDEEAADRTLSIDSTKSKIESGQEATGWPVLAELLSKSVVEKVRKWLRIDKSDVTLVDRNDLGNALKFANRFGEDFKWSPKLDWLAWDGTRWQREAAEQLARSKANEIVDDLIHEGLAKTDDDHRKKQLAWAITSGMSSHLDGMLKVARSLPRILVMDPAVFDRHPLLLNCHNGTLDLETVELRDWNRDDMITRRAEVEWKRDATDPTFQKLLHDSMRGHEDLQGYLPQAFGYSLTGLPDEEKLFFLYGPTASGKSTLVQAFRAMLGDYAVTADFETFLKKKNDSGTRNDIARLAGARFVPSIEVSEGKEIAENLVKTLTGGDVISARFLYKEFFEFLPSFKLWLVANNRPYISEEEAIWRRIDVVPFDNVVPKEKRDPKLKKHLTTSPQARSAILAWAVAGYQKWRAAKTLVPSLSVAAATQDYREFADTFSSFLRACCNVRENAVTEKPVMRRAYEQWSTENGSLPLGARRFQERMLKLRARDDLKVIAAKSGDAVWRHIELTDEGHQTADRHPRARGPF